MRGPSKQATILSLVIVLLTVAYASCSAVTPDKPKGSRLSPVASQAPSMKVLVARHVVARRLAAGEFSLPAAGAFGQAGFHKVLAASGRLPRALGRTSGMRLVVMLRDAGRQNQTCSSEHPLSGCATVDWSDNESRPHVPPGGVFDNSLIVRLASGSRKFFLSESGVLADKPDAFSPG